MPNLDGISATRNIRQYDTLTPIISMTSNTTDSDIIEYFGSGMTDVLPKPFSKQSLFSMLDKYCAHLKAIQRNYGIEQGQIPRNLGELGLPAIPLATIGSNVPSNASRLQEQASTSAKPETNDSYGETSNAQNSNSQFPSALSPSFFNFSQLPPHFTNFMSSISQDNTQQRGANAEGREWRSTNSTEPESERSQKKRKTGML